MILAVILTSKQRYCYKQIFIYKKNSVLGYYILYTYQMFKPHLFHIIDFTDY